MDKNQLLDILKNGGKAPVELEGLPLNTEQKQWLGGFLSGIQVQVKELGGFGAKAGKPITIIYGSQTGNSEAMANEAAAAAKKHGLAPQVIDMSDVDVATLAASERILVVTSTYGEGEMPDNAQVLWDEISGDDAPSFENSFFSVLALGDSSYDGFCTAGKEWDARLEALGAERVAPRVDCDVEFEEPGGAWIEEVMPIITAKGSQDVVEVASSEASNKPKHTRKDPLEAVLLRKKTVSGAESSKEIVHYEFSLGNSGETYLAGDALNIIPENRPDFIQELLDLFGTTADEVTMNELKYDLELRSPSKDLIQLVASKTDDERIEAFG